MSLWDDYVSEHQRAQPSTYPGEASSKAPADPRLGFELNGRCGVDSPMSTGDESAA